MPDGLSTTFDDNVGADAMVVWSGPITYGSANTGPVGGPRNFDIIMTFTTPFLYDPSMGNLLVEFRSTGLFAPVAFDQQSAIGDSVSFISGGIDSPTANFVITGGLVTQFTFSPTAVPEPATLMLMGTGLVGVAAIVKRRKSKRSH